MPLTISLGFTPRLIFFSLLSKFVSRHHPEIEYQPWFLKVFLSQALAKQKDKAGRFGV
jgi:hypothetical protein